MFGKRGGVAGVVMLLAAPLASCAAGGSSEARIMQEALQPLRDAESYRMVGEFRSPDGKRTAFDAHVDAHGGCEGTVGVAESLLFEQRVWTRWDDSALDEAVATLMGGPVATVDPVAPAEESPAWAAARLLRGAYMVTDLPAEKPQLEGIAPVCKTGELLAGAGDGGGDVISGGVTVRGGERLRLLTRSDGPVTIRVYVPEKGKPETRLVEYYVEGGRSFSVRFGDLGKPVTVTPPEGQQSVSSDDVMTVLRRDRS